MATVIVTNLSNPFATMDGQQITKIQWVASGIMSILKE